MKDRPCFACNHRAHEHSVDSNYGCCRCRIHIVNEGAVSPSQKLSPAAQAAWDRLHASVEEFKRDLQKRPRDSAR